MWVERDTMSDHPEVYRPDAAGYVARISRGLSPEQEAWLSANMSRMPTGPLADPNEGDQSIRARQNMPPQIQPPMAPVNWANPPMAYQQQPGMTLNSMPQPQQYGGY